MHETTLRLSHRRRTTPQQKLRSDRLGLFLAYATLERGDWLPERAMSESAMSAANRHAELTQSKAFLAWINSHLKVGFGLCARHARAGTMLGLPPPRTTGMLFSVSSPLPRVPCGPLCGPPCPCGASVLTRRAWIVAARRWCSRGGDLRCFSRHAWLRSLLLCVHSACVCALILT